MTYRRYDNKDNLSGIFYTYTPSDGGTEYVENNLSRSYGELTELHGNDKISFGYDDRRRLKKITVAGNTGSKTFDYSEDTTKETVTATNENGGVVKCESAKDGSYEKVYYNGTLQLASNYNYKGELESVEDKLSDEVTAYGYNSLGQMISYTEKQNNATKVKQNFVYDEYGNISQDKITGQVSHTYNYSYDDLFDRRFNGMSFGGITEEVTYDDLDRIKTKKVTYNGAEVYTKSYAYRDVQHGSKIYATNQPKSIVYKKGTATKQNIQYAYNDMTGKLSGITVNGKTITYYYEYDKLRREDSQLLNASFAKYYHDNGNIATDIKGNYQPGTSTVSGTSTFYTYDGDRLTKFGNEVCEYDNMGNPTTYRGKSATWNGRQLTKLGTTEFTYDGQGRRVSKNSLTFLYDSNGNIIKQSNGLEFFYDFEGIAALKHNNTMYFCLRDSQGNIIALIDNNGNTVVQYYYDAWGNHKVVDENGDEITSSTHIGNVNPFRYRGYYYDTETGLYFLQTRYYDPEVGRFLNRDSVQYADPETINGLNLYAYCLNNPIEYTDPYGTTEWWEWLLGAAIIVAAVGLSIATAGLASSFSAALGGGFAASMAGGAIASGASGAISAFGISVGSQIIFNGADNIKWNQVYNDTLNGLASGIAAGAIFGAIRYLFPIDKIASSLSGLDRAQDYYNRAEFIFRSTPILFNGGVMATERIVARLNFEIARYSLGLFENRFMLVNCIVGNVYRAGQFILKRIIGDIIG